MNVLRWIGNGAAIWLGLSFFVGGLFCLRPLRVWLKAHLDRSEPPMQDPDNMSGATS